MPPLHTSWPLTFWPWKRCRVTCDVGYLCANFSLPRPLCSRLRPDVRDRQTLDRQTSDAHHRLMPLNEPGACLTKPASVHPWWLTTLVNSLWLFLHRQLFDMLSSQQKAVTAMNAKMTTFNSTISSLALALALESRPWHKSSRPLTWLIPVFSCQTQRISCHCHFCQSRDW